MKKVFALILSLMLILSVGTVCAFAAEGESAEVYVTIADKDGKTVVAAEKLTVTDTDSDSVLTINDALYAAHEKFYEGGAAAGYGTAVTQYGLGVTKLWGDANGKSGYGYYVNNVSAWALTDPIKDYDYIAAFCYTDLEGFSDNYSYFDSFMGDVNAEEELKLTYYQAGYDENWTPVIMPVEGAVITVDGVATEITTDAEGKAAIKLTENGRHIISAKKDGKTLVAPVFAAAVTGGTDPTEPATEAAPKDNPNAVKTGSSANAVYVSLAVMIAAFAVIMLVSVRKKNNEE